MALPRAEQPRALSFSCPGSAFIFRIIPRQHIPFPGGIYPHDPSLVPVGGPWGIPRRLRAERRLLLLIPCRGSRCRLRFPVHHSREGPTAGTQLLFQPGPIASFPTEFPSFFLAGARNFSATVTSVGIATRATGVAPLSPGCILRHHRNSHLWHKRDTVIWDRSRHSSCCRIPRQSPGGVSGSSGAGRRLRALLRTGHRLPKGVPGTTPEPGTRKSRV